jgi:carboxynorspermidine decarboxylase
LGATKTQLARADLRGIDGLHFHTLCELGADALQRTLAVVEEELAPWLERAKWVNFGGGHHITKPGYDVGLLIDLVRNFRHEYDVDVYLEPGEAIGLNTGVLVASVLDIVENEGPIALLDTSATAHMPDVLEMPYRPEVRGASEPGRRAHTYRLGGLSCLAGDMIGAYSFDKPLNVGDKLVFEDMAHYTMVKTTTFNGVRLPSIALYDPSDDRYRVQRTFGYEDYRNRLS